MSHSLTFQANQITLETTRAGICGLEEQYGYSMVFATLVSLWSLEQTADYFDYTSNKLAYIRSIRTIATCFYRVYDGGTERVNAELMKLWTKMGLNVMVLTDELENVLDYEYTDFIKTISSPKFQRFEWQISDR